MILRKAIAIALVGLVVSAPAMAGTLDDRYGVLDRQTATELNQVIQKADANGLDLSVFILKNQDLMGSTFDNLDIEQTSKALLNKHAQEGQKGFVIMIVTDRINADGSSPTIRWFTKENIGVWGTTLDNLFADLKAQRDRGQWQVGLVGFSQSVVDSVIAVNNLYLWLFVALLALFVIAAIFGKGGSSSGNSDSYYYFDSGSSGGGDVSGGD